MTTTDVRIELPRAIARARMAFGNSTSEDFVLCATLLQPFEELLERLDREGNDRLNAACTEAVKRGKP